ncbi:MAG: AI-2E family transporter [Hyphomicrobiales bacterium]|nr:MAG: AI-2E family transporter [Hyphomicrobiales bacterium]
MTLSRQISFWIGTFVVLMLFLYVFRDILLPFIAGMGLAYLLDPVADRLERIGFSRMWATVSILLMFLLLFLLTLIILAPVLGHQLAGFIERLPSYASALQTLIADFADGRENTLLGMSREDLQVQMGDLLTQGASWLGKLMKSLWNGGQALLSILSLFVVTPVVAFYLLYDWDRMIDSIDSWLPRDHLDVIRRLANEMNDGVAGFLRGQMALCLILAVYYAVGLSLLGLNFGLLIGLTAGFVSFIPYVGASLGFVLSVGVALVQFMPDWVMIVAVFVVFVVGQFLEGNILQPKLVGQSVGLHPVWLMFALFAFGYLFGFVGMLIAVPAAAAVAVLVRFALTQYLASPLYRGKDAPATPEE